MKPVLFSQRVEVVESYNERRDCVDQRVTDFIFQCGYIPVAMPNDPAKAEQIFTSVAPVGIILTGGNSLAKYGGDAPERDETERMMIRIALEKGIPLYGFCRGMQSILDYFGNELVEVSGHVAVRHVVIGTGESVEVNSFHHQGCINLNSAKLVALMRANDGVIEKVHHTEKAIVGTMWHPERENPFRDSDINMVKNLFGDYMR